MVINMSMKNKNIIEELKKELAPISPEQIIKNIVEELVKTGSVELSKDGLEGFYPVIHKRDYFNELYTVHCKNYHNQERKFYLVNGYIKSVNVARDESSNFKSVKVYSASRLMFFYFLRKRRVDVRSPLKLVTNNNKR